MNENNLKTTKAVAAVKPVNYVELIAGWCDLFEVLFAVTWIFGMFSFYRTMDGERSMATAALASAILLLIAWIPGLTAGYIFQDKQKAMGRFLSVYKSHSVFADGLKTAINRCTGLPDSITGIGTVVTVIFCLGIMLCNLLSILLPDSWLLSMAFGAILSLCGFFTILICVARDYIRELIKRHQIM